MSDIDEVTVQWDEHSTICDKINFLRSALIVKNPKIIEECAQALEENQRLKSLLNSVVKSVEMKDLKLKEIYLLEWIKEAIE